MKGFDISYNGVNQEFGIFRGAHLSSPQDFYTAINFGQPFYLDEFTHRIDKPKQEVQHHIAKISAYQRFADFGKLSFQYSFQLNRRQEFDIRKSELNERPSMDLRLITHSVSLTHLLERSNWTLENGISAAFQDNFPNPETKARRLIPDYYRYDGGFFSVFKYRFNAQFNAEAAARYDFSRYDAYKYYDAETWEEQFAELFSGFFISKSGSRVLTRPILDYHKFSANIGFNYKPMENIEFKLNLSKADRAPNAAELFSDGLHHSAAVMEEGNLSIKKETVYNINLSLDGQFNVLKGLRIEANPYFMISKNFINQIPTDVTNTSRGVFPVWTYQQIKARIYGLDADAELSVLKNLKWKSSFSILRGDDLSHNEPLILMMPTKWRNSIEFTLDQPKNFYLSLENENSFKQSRFPIRNLPVTFIKDGIERNETVDFSTPPPAFTLFNVAVGADLAKNLNLNLRINNVFNTEYREYLNRLRYYMFEPGRNVVVTFKYNF